MATSAERQAAYRARKQAELEALLEGKVDESIPGLLATLRHVAAKLEAEFKRQLAPQILAGE